MQISEFVQQIPTDKG